MPDAPHHPLYWVENDLGERVTPPTFDGWSGLGRDESWQEGDVLVHPFPPKPGDVFAQQYWNPDHGLPINAGHFGWTMQKGIDASWYVYRPHGRQPMAAPQPPPKPPDDDRVFVLDRQGDAQLAPVFPGWRAVPVDDPMEEGDVAVCPFEYNLVGGDASTPDRGQKVLSFNFGRTSRQGLMTGWVAYRPTGPRPPRMLPGNAHYSEPLSLP